MLSAVLITNLIIVFLLFFAIAKAYKQGFISEFGSLISAILTASLFLYLYQWWNKDSILKIVIVVFLFLVAWAIFKLAYWLLKKILKIFYIIPYFKVIDQFFGAFLGIFEGVIYVAIVHYIFLAFPNNFWIKTDFLSFILYIAKKLLFGI